MADSPDDDQTGLGNLPEACISAILGCMSAQDVLNASCVNSTFAAAASSDLLWQSLLPAGSEEAIEHALWDRPSPYDSVRLHASDQPAVQQIMGHLINGVQGGGVPGGRGRFRGRPLLFVPRAGGPNARAQNDSRTNTTQSELASTSGSSQQAGDVRGREQETAVASGAPNTPKDLFRRLANGVLLREAGTESFRVNPCTMGVERMFSALGASITWGPDTRYWRQTPGHGSFFGASMYLLSVCWLEVNVLGNFLNARF
jgi:hypothetical protein